MRRIGPLLLAAGLTLPASATAHTDTPAHDDQSIAHHRIHEGKKNRSLDANPAVPGERLSDVACEQGFAGPFECDGIDLLSFVPYDEFVGDELTISPGLSDIWGWTDEETGDEYVILGASNGVEFFRVTDPTDPVHLGSLENTSAVQLIWHDIKVFKDHAFVVSESNPHGMRIFDLTRLRGIEEPQPWIEDVLYPLPSAAHNVAINTDTGFAYIVGGNAGLVAPDQCLSGLHIVDINEPQTPVFAGCYAQDGGPGTLARLIGAGQQSPAAYVHDTQCVVYNGPDRRYTGREICVNSSETLVAIADVTDKSNPQTVSTADYPHVGYTHQGWLTEDHAYFILGDEGDENGIPAIQNTRSILFDVTDLENPKVIGEHLFETRSIDHNLYVKDGLAYHSNYESGLRVTDTANIADGVLEEVAFFDTFPNLDRPQFNGTWSNYPFFDSGTVAVSGIDEGLFLVRLQDHVRRESPEDTTRVERLEVAESDGRLAVEGRALFRGETEQVGSDPEGDAAAPGADMTGASITALDQNLLEFVIDVANLPPATQGTPETVQYNWELTTTRDGEESTYMLSALRTGQAQRTGSATASFNLSTCQDPDGPEPGQCFLETEVVGRFSEDGVRFTVPSAAIDAAGGAEIAQGPRTLRTVLSAAGRAWFVNPAPVLFDEMPLDPFAFPGSTVEVGIAPADVPPDEVELEAADLTLHTGRFGGLVDVPEEPGVYQVLARACFGPESCATAVRTIEVP